jgi:hypothetical protein
MKSQRRHELKTNSLATKLENAPAYFQQYGTRILLVAIFCMLGYIWYQRHNRDQIEKADASAKSMGTALFHLNQLRSLSPYMPPEQIASARKTEIGDIERAISEVLDGSEDPKLRAQAMVARGDLNWELANFPPLPGAATRPAELGLEKTSDEYLKSASNAYSEVLQPPLNVDEESVIAARYSLGKIAESRSNWDEAKADYQKIIDDPLAGQGFKDLATASIAGLKSLEKPIFVGSDVELPTPPVQGPKPFGPFLPDGLTPPSATTPATQPTAIVPTSTAPTTQPSVAVPPAALPTTQPATAPSLTTLPSPATRPSQP